EPEKSRMYFWQLPFCFSEVSNMRATAAHAVEPAVAMFGSNPLAKLLAACCAQKAKPKLDRSRWGEIEMCREALRAHDFASANSRYDALLHKARRRGDQRLEAKILGDLAFMHRILGDIQVADSYYKDAYRAWKSQQLTIYSPALSDYIHCVLDYAAFL